MPGKAVRIPPDLLARFERFAERESKARNRAGLLPISGADLLRVVASRFVGLPASHDVDLAALRVREGLPADMTTPPHGGTTTKARRTAKKSSLTMETPPHGGRTAKARRTAKKSSLTMETPPHGGRTAKKASP